MNQGTGWHFIATTDSRHEALLILEALTHQGWAVTIILWRTGYAIIEA